MNTKHKNKQSQPRRTTGEISTDMVPCDHERERRERERERRERGRERERRERGREREKNEGTEFVEREITKDFGEE